MTSLHTIPSIFGIDRNGDFFPNFAAHLKVFGNLAEIADELACGGRSVEGRVVAHRAKERLAIIEILAELTEALASKGGLCILSLLDLALPALIGPGGGAKTDEG